LFGGGVDCEPQPHPGAAGTGKSTLRFNSPERWRRKAIPESVAFDETARILLARAKRRDWI
jgi:hypothetical protein